MEDVSTIIILSYCFSYSSQEKVENISAFIILCLLFWVFKSRDIEGRLTELLQCFLSGFGYSSHDKVEDVSAIKIRFLLLWILKSRESAGRPNYYHTFLLLWVLESRERGGHLNCQHSLSVALGTQAKRKSRTSQLLAYCLYYFGSSSHEKVKDV